ncbi:MAG: hypothetical protein B6I36_09535 [Desulfobacteraceae bacterium 4572_35.1]|nr:MAG: hypothetical protein B6I36_09535 [Desulfobacteraceae bacterium 4572_35.1]
MKNISIKAIIATTAAIITLATPVIILAAPEKQQQKNSSDGQSFSQEDYRPGSHRGNILNMVLDKAPELPTQRGTLVIKAFYDRNGDHQLNHGEQELKGEITCSVDDINYQVPAFIPALKYNAHYRISCKGSRRFRPAVHKKNILIARHGEIISLTIPCMRN